MLYQAIALLEPTAPAAALAAAAERPGFVALLAGNAALAYVVNFTNFQITKLTSALTLQARTCIPMAGADAIEGFQGFGSGNKRYGLRTLMATTCLGSNKNLRRAVDIWHSCESSAPCMHKAGPPCRHMVCVAP